MCPVVIEHTLPGLRVGGVNQREAGDRSVGIGMTLNHQRIDSVGCQQVHRQPDGLAAGRSTPVRRLGT